VQAADFTSTRPQLTAATLQAEQEFQFPLLLLLPDKAVHLETRRRVTFVQGMHM
jgi:hypothetical protein